MKYKNLFLYFLLTTLFVACEKDKNEGPKPVDPDMAEEVSVDRFSSEAGHLFVIESGL